MKINPYLLFWTKLKPRCMKYLYIKLDTHIVIKEKFGKTLEFTGTGVYFLNRTSTAQAQRSRIHKWGLMKLEIFGKAKGIVKRTNRKPTDWEKVFTILPSFRGLIYKIENSRS